MKIKSEVTIDEITHDDLVNLFSTALYGSSYLTADYEEAIEQDEEDCFEDELAKILLHGGSIQVTDHYAEGCVHGKLPHTIDKYNDECVTYSVTLDAIVKGLANAANGTFKLCGNKEYAEQDKKAAKKSFDNLAEESVDFDWVRADILMQIILFNEIIYG